MGMKLFNETNVSQIAGIVRNKLGISTQYKIAQLPTAVQNAIDKYRNACPKATSTSVCDSALDVPIVNYDIYGNSTQNTTTGKNKWSLSNSYHTNTGSEYVIRDTPIDIPAGTYTISFNRDSNSRVFFGFKNSDNIEEDVMIDNTSITVTFNDDKKKVFIYIYGNVATTISNIQIEQGSTATSYEPYTGGISSPNPSYPQEITSVGDLVTSGEHVGKYKIPVTISGKNLFDNSVGGQVGEYLTREGNVSTGANTLRYTNYIAIKNNQANITISGMTNTMASPSLCFYDENKNFISGFNYNSMSEVTLTIPNNAVYLRTSYRTSNTQTQIEYGSSATTYEPYHTPITTDIYLDEPLRKVGTVADYIDFVTGKRHNLIGKTVLNGSESWTRDMSGSSFSDGIMGIRTSISDMKTFNSFAYGDLGISCLISDLFIQNNLWRSIINGIDCGWGSLFFVKVRTDIIGNPPDYDTAVQYWKTYLTTHNMTLYYQLETETTEDITLPSFNLWTGTNIFTIGTEVQPSNTQWQYITTNYTVE